MRKKGTGGIWKYLDDLGVLEKGSDAEIKAAKKAYWKNYFLSYKQSQRKKKAEYSITYSKENGEYARILQAARKHNMTSTAFIHAASLAYVDKTYVVPDKMQIARLEQLLSDCLNEIKTLVSKKERFFWDKEQKLNAIEKRIVKLESQINDVLRNPPLIYDSQNQVA